MTLFLLWSCAAPLEDRAPLPAFVDGIPHVHQRPDFCGEACLAMALAARGLDVDQDEVFALTGVDPLAGRGAVARELVVAAQALGYAPGPVWTAVPDADALDAAFSALVDDLRAGIASIVCTRFDAAPNAPEHFHLVIGYDPQTDEVRFHDPALQDGADLRMGRGRFLRLWPLSSAEGRIAVRLRLAGAPHRPETPSGSGPADLAQAARVARELISGSPSAFHIVAEGPWLLVGDGGAAEVEARRKTVAWTTQQLRADFFPRDPPDVWTIWLFADDASYVGHTEAFFGRTPHTPYGYADGERRALVMNIGTGGGTLVHELVHPFIDANLPGCPPWINEGLASLYEHVGERGGHIWGFPNWRLPGLQVAIREGDLPSLRWLTAATPDEFYGESGGTNYAMARYLMQYLQDEGHLRPFVAAYTAGRGADPTGYQTLLDTVGADDVAAFSARWEAWALGLSRPR